MIYNTINNERYVTKMNALIHWHDPKSGDGMVRTWDGNVYYFYHVSDKPLVPDSKIEILLFNDITFMQAQIYNPLSTWQKIELSKMQDYNKKVG